jgi:group I intron endonuclease
MTREKRLLLKPIWYIYKTTCIINNKIYVGKHKCYEKPDKNYLGSGKLLWFAIKKYGKDKFIQEILEFCESEEQNCEREKFWIKKLNSQNRKIGYNTSPGGEGGISGFNRETNKWFSLENWSKLTSEEHSIRVKKIKAGINKPETRKKISKASKNWHEKMTEEEKKEWTKSLSHPKKSNENYKGSKNSMYGKSVYSVWEKKYGKEKATEMMEDYKKRLSISLKNNKGIETLKNNNKLRMQSPYWKEYNQEQHKIQHLNFQLKKGIISFDEYSNLIEQQRIIVKNLRNKVNLYKENTND